MLVFTRPAEQSQWLDEVDNITFTVLGTENHDVLVHCQYGNRTWNDILDVSLFGTELKEVK